MDSKEPKYKKLAFCFLVYDRVFHERMWELFFNQVDPSRYDIFIHYKLNKKFKSTGFFKGKELPKEKIVPTKHGHPSLVLAQRIMYKEALDAGAYKMLTISHSCVPVKSFEEVYDRCVSTEKSEFFSQGKKHALARCSSACATLYDPEHLRKSEQWFILNRRCAYELLTQKDSTIQHVWRGTFASDEHFFITHLNSKNLVGKEVKFSPFRITYVNWGYGDIEPNNDTEMLEERKTNGRKPRAYYKIGDKEIEWLIDSPHLFARKFTKESQKCFFNNKKYLEKVLKV
jgi:hypothetical protein